MPATKQVHFTIDIAAPAAAVFETMVGPQSYKEWTAPFAEGSYYEGVWQQGEKIRFLSPTGDGMVSEIAEHRPDEFTSIRHIGLISKGVEDTQSAAARAWAPAYENYSFIPIDGGTCVRVDQDVTEDFEAYISEAWPKALARLKALCEADGQV